MTRKEKIEYLEKELHRTEHKLMEYKNGTNNQSKALMILYVIFGICVGFSIGKDF